ncbi:acyl carrier protein [Clostridium acetobutylicum]|uniref:Acyl carrier protein homolog n=1 Tax=Clostridium acetobutylicum (strain ATCC 824 / DSM 792 / JCM 1419 / IAM 19013 / LMG 5710 / NBRC 13948 / NRRL B-527 / VKM B-1787 / 2291 / W) TaxID=272562 RepID=ACPH_CLOAB|nr:MULTISPECIES: acyl carrier protein [Clostridium]Q97HJ4.1 RecName: Full=Acyl carrier protein homolog; Short=ACP [Clostridium acetobutylicum ATCC 824]AAK79976.1 Acyl carrier protein [Clostridium acetobutylicum ATCC 824]ADZ21069.1 Acyl carrier protein [Clostridium acetobutylicum EA 2018]AEI32130.1 Acyl carrier protein [Clostridium acetobutylicum DSM 1731]AWV79593.1 acyl carrier protein [Clostridium acetobutylicum]MBC2394434.1 acyl carrier protein [Clostridium acetobutylicum]
MRELTSEIKKEIRDIVYDFFSEECEVDINELNDNTSVVDDLDGDSLMLIELVDILKKKYSLNIQLQSIGKYLLKNPAETLEKVVQTTYLLYEYENDITNVGEK